MAELDISLCDALRAACEENKADLAESFGQAIQAEIEVSVGDATQLDNGQRPPQWEGPGVVLVWKVGQGGALMMIPESPP